MDDLTLRYREDSPEFYGLVENPDHYDDRSAEGAVEGGGGLTARSSSGVEMNRLAKTNIKVFRGKKGVGGHKLFL